mgnify:CR=1 FL=1
MPLVNGYPRWVLIGTQASVRSPIQDTSTQLIGGRYLIKNVRLRVVIHERRLRRLLTRMRKANLMSDFMCMNIWVQACVRPMHGMSWSSFDGARACGPARRRTPADTGELLHPDQPVTPQAALFAA